MRGGGVEKINVVIMPYGVSVYVIEKQSTSVREREGKKQRSHISYIDFLTISACEKAGRDLPVGDRKENIVRKQCTNS